MKQQTKNDHKPSVFLQFTINFVLPIIILTRFSSESQLGPIKSMLLALAFPVAFELYNVYKRKKFSLISLIAIGGILVTGAISLLGLSEGWLAARRSIPYFVVASAFLVSIWIKRPLLQLLLPKMIDMDRVTDAARERQTLKKLNRHLLLTGYLVSILFLTVAVISYILVLATIKSPAGTEGFNAEYARLRILALPFTTAPLFVGFIACVMFLFFKIEKLTGIDLDTILKKPK